MREDLVPTLLGTVVTGAGLVATMPVKRREIRSMVTAGVVGFGLAHVVLGSIDLIQGK